MTDIAFFSIQSNFIFEKIRIREGEVNEDYTSNKKKTWKCFPLLEGGSTDPLAQREKEKINSVRKLR